MTQKERSDEDNFEISLRILGNEILGMRMTSASRMRNWAVFGLLTLVAIGLLAAETVPVFLDVIETYQQ